MKAPAYHSICAATLAAPALPVALGLAAIWMMM